MGVLLIIGGLACVAWIIRREVIEREEMAEIGRGERPLSWRAAFWGGFRRGIRLWVLGLGGIALIAAGAAQMAQG